MEERSRLGLLDFVGIFDKLEKALAFDSGDVSGVVKDIEVLKQRFVELMKLGKSDYLVLLKGKKMDKAVEAVLEHFKNEDERQEFYGFFKELSNIYEILSPDAFLRQYIEDFDTLARMFRILREAFEPGIMVDREFARKTADLVKKHTHSGKIRSVLEVYEINENTLKKIEESNASDTEHVFNLLKSIGLDVEKNKGLNPYLVSIGDKAELISMLYKQRQKDTKETLEELKDLLVEINEAKKEQKERRMSSEEFSVYWLLKEEDISEAKEKAKGMKNVFEKFPHWKTSQEHERGLKREILKTFTREKMEPKRAVSLVSKILLMLKEASE